MCGMNVNTMNGEVYQLTKSRETKMINDEYE